MERTLLIRAETVYHTRCSLDLQITTMGNHGVWVSGMLCAKIFYLGPKVRVERSKNLLFS